MRIRSEKGTRNELRERRRRRRRKNQKEEEEETGTEGGTKASS
jgi:hypothetical protein